MCQVIKLHIVESRLVVVCLLRVCVKLANGGVACWLLKPNKRVLMFKSIIYLLYIFLCRVLKTFHVATNGTAAINMYSPSEVQRLSLLKHELVEVVFV